MSKDLQHAWERAGHGLAPFRVVGHSKGQQNCDVCGAHLVNAFRVRSSDAREFIVGSDCVRKTGDAGLLKSYKREAERARAATTLGKWSDLLANPAAVAKLGESKPYLPLSEETFLSFASRSMASPTLSPKHAEFILKQANRIVEN